MWLLVEDGSIINLDLVSKVVPKHHQKTATVYEAGIVAVADSKVAYRFFCSSTKINRINWSASKVGDSTDWQKNEE